MRFEKKNLPNTKIRIKAKWVLGAGYFILIFMISYLYASRSSGTTNVDYVGDFYQMKPEPGELSPILWREDGSYVAPNAYRILIPTELTNAIKAYCDEVGLTDYARDFIMSKENNIQPDGYRFIELGGVKWFAQRPASKWNSDMHWISPADESGHEAYLRLLTENGFLSVLNSIGDALDLDGLTAYHLTFIVVSHCERGYVHHDTTGTGNKVFNVVIPVERATDSPPELIIADSRDDTIGRLKYEDNIAVMIGDDVHHATSECDYRDTPGKMRFAATIYIADINESNTETIALSTLTQAFPPPDPIWVFAQRGRHWINARNRDDLDLRNGADHFIGDRGRAVFQTENLSERCNQVQDASKECSFLETRKECPSTCGIYLDSSFYINNIFTGPNMTSKW